MNRVTPFDHLILLLATLFMLTPVVVAVMTSTHTAVDIHSDGLFLLPGSH